MHNEHVTRGVFLGDLHLPYNISLKGILDYVKDFNPHYIVLGGDLIDAEELHGCDHWSADVVELIATRSYKKDLNNLRLFMEDLVKVIKDDTKIVYLEGNHEERYVRLMNKFPNILRLPQDRFDFVRDCFTPELKARTTFVKYGTYNSYWLNGDCKFMHGHVFPDHHAKKMAMDYPHHKMCYGHNHDFQAYSLHSGDPHKASRYAISMGTLAKRDPDYKTGKPNRWVNMFGDWVNINGTVLLTPHVIEHGRFYVGQKVYGEPL